MATTCPTCGADVRDDANVCDVCGGVLPAAPAPGDEPPGGGPPPPPPPSAAAAGTWGPPPAPHPSGLSSETRNWGMAAHLSSFAGAMLAGVASFVGPLVIWLVKRDEHPFIAHHAKEALNFNLSILLYAIVSAVLVLALVGIPLLIAVGLIYVIFTVIAAVKAANGEGYRYPLTIRFIS